MSQPALPFADPALDAPIAYGLTARARRVVAPSTLPGLTVLPGEGEGAPDRFDTRPARARALRRSGRDLSQIAAELQVEEAVAAIWTLDVAPVPLRLGRHRPASRARRVREDVSAALEQTVVAAENDLAAASLVLGLAEVTAHAVALTTSDPKVARVVVDWMRRRMGVDAGRLRITLATGPAVARDMAVHRWAETMGVPVQRVLAAPWPDASEATAVRATLRLADARVAALVSSWRADLLAVEPPDEEATAATASLG